LSHYGAASDHGSCLALALPGQIMSGRIYLPRFALYFAFLTRCASASRNMRS